MFCEFSSDVKQIYERLLAEESYLRFFPSKDVNEIAKRTIFNIKCDCDCPEPASVAPTDTDRVVTPSDVPPAPGVPSLKELRDAMLMDTRDGIEWALPILTYGLTLPVDHWEVVQHSSHILCYWLRDLLPSGRKSSDPSVPYPRCLRREPLRYLDRILFSLAYFFFPRHPDPLSGQHEWLLSTLGVPVSDVRRSSGSEQPDSVDASPASIIERGCSPALLSNQIDITCHIVQAVEAVVADPSHLSANAWDTLLQFCLVVCHLVLSPPLPTLLPLSKQGASFNSYVSTGSSFASELTLNAMLYHVSDSPNDPMFLFELLADRVVTMLMNVWLKACAYCFPRPQLWIAFKECVQPWRHQSIFISHWSQLVVSLTHRLIPIMNAPSKISAELKTYLDQTVLAAERANPVTIPRDISAEYVKETWFRFFYLLGNPVDLCDPQTLATPVIEKLIKLSPAEDLGPTVNRMPYIFHVAIRTFSMVVDAFLGNSLSVNFGTEPSKWVPKGLYFQSPLSSNTSEITNSGLMDSEEPRRAATQFTKVRGSTPSVISEKPSRKSKHSATSSVFFPSAGSSLLSSTQTGPAVVTSGTVQTVQSPMSTIQQQSTASILQHPASTLAPSGKSTGSIFYWPRARVDNKGKVSTRTSAFWLGPEPHLTLSNQCPEANTLFQLVGPWLFEAAVISANKLINVSVISTRAERFGSYLNFQVARAEALGALCRIMLCAKRTRLARPYLVRFYLCLYYGLDLEHARCDYVISSILFNAIDLLRCDLPGVNIMLPTLFDVCHLVFTERLTYFPYYLDMVLIRRAAIHQLMSMVCIPIQFRGRHLKPLVPIVASPKDPVSLNDIKGQLTHFLCNVLNKEKDPINFQMLICTSLALLEDMVADEQISPVRHLSVRPRDAGSQYQKLHTASGYFNNLVRTLWQLLNKEHDSDAIIHNLLEFFHAVATIRVTPSDPTVYRELIRQICEFISTQCQRHTKFHTRHLHSIIVMAFSTLSALLAEHFSTVVAARDCLQTVLAAIELGLSGKKSKDQPTKIILKEHKPFTPASKRVSDAAESCLAVFMSLAASSSAVPVGKPMEIVEDKVIELFSPPDVAKQPKLVQQLRDQFSYYWIEPGLVVGILELARCRALLESKGFTGTELNSSNGFETTIIVRGPFGRHCWISRMRYFPVSGPDSETSGSCATKPSRPEPWGCFLERLIESVTRNETLSSPCFPEAVSEVPLTDADLSIPRWEKLMGDPGSPTEELLRQLKSTIMKQSLRVREVGLRCVKEELASPKPSPTVDAKPSSPKSSHHAARLWLTHLSFLPYNTFNMIERNSMSAELLPLPISTSLDLDDSAPLSGALSATASVLSMSSDWDESRTWPCPTIFPMNSRDPNFRDFLADLDGLPTRTTNSMFVFYLASGQSSLDQMLSNSIQTSWSKLQPEFHAFLEALGSISPLPSSTESAPDSSGRIQIPNGKQHIIYWANATTELVCQCPMDYTSAVDQNVDKISSPSNQKATLVSDSDGDPTGGRVAVVWLERWEDGPINASPDSPGMLIYEAIKTKFNCPVAIYIHMLSSKLYRIGVLSPPGYVYKAGPVINGLVLSSRCLSSMIRRTVINISRRRRLASDLFAPPHVKRRCRIAEMEQRHKRLASQSTANQPIDGQPEVMLSLLSSLN